MKAMKVHLYRLSLLLLATLVWATQAKAVTLYEEENDSTSGGSYDEENDSTYRLLFPEAIEVGPDTGFVVPAIQPSPEILPDHVLNSAVPDIGPFVYSEAGQIPIEGNVTPTGARTYTVPIELPAGMAGFTPQLSLVYNSMSGQGLVGMGWTIAGLSSISRGNKSVYYDGIADGIGMTEDDAFFLDGMRLIPTGPNTYETEQGSILVKSHTSGSVVQYFDVRYPDGRTCVYGYTSNGTNRLSYPMTSIEDIHGNSISYTYTFINNHYLPNTIVYNGNSVQFAYTNRDDVIDRYCKGLPLNETKLLSSMTCRVGGNVIRTYRLSYTVRDGNSLLTSIGCEGSDGTSLNPLSFYYGTGYKGNVYSQKTITLRSGVYTGETVSVNVAEGKIDYFNGSDGLLIFKNEDPYWYVHEPGHLFSHSKDYFVNKYAANQRIFVYTGLGENGSAYDNNALLTEKGFIDIFCADIDGKQFENVVQVNNSVENNFDQVRFKVYEPTANSSLSYSYMRTFQDNTVFEDQSGHKSISPKLFMAGDFDGDGRMEIMAVSADKPLGDSSFPSKCYIYDLRTGTTMYSGELLTYERQFLSNGDDEDDQFNKQNNLTDRLMPIDYDGDGKTDLVHINSTGLHVYTFDVTGAGLSGRLAASYTGLSRSTLNNRSLMPCDINGDGLLDFLLSPERGSSSDQWKVYKSKGNGSFVYSTKSGPTYARKQEFYAHDINADGKAELLSRLHEILQTYSLDGSSMQLQNTEFLPADSTKLVMTNISSRNYTATFMTLRNDTVTKYAFEKNLSRDALLTGMANSLRLVEKTEYRNICGPNSSFYTRGTDAAFPFVNMVEEMPVVFARETYLDGNAQDMTYYRYSDAVLHRQGRGFMGFRDVTTVNSRGRQTLTAFAPYEFGQMMYSISPKEKTFCEYSVDLQADKRVQVRLEERRHEDLLTGFSSTTTYEYDSYGYPILEETVYSDGITRTTGNLYQHKKTDSLYKLGTIKKCDRTVSNGSDSHTETEQVLCFLTDMSPSGKRWKTDGNTVKTERYDYDTHGNVVSTDVVNYTSDMELTTDYEYDSYGRLTLVSDPLANETTYTYGSLGHVAGKTDKYGTTTTYEYDGFGRVVSESVPCASDKNRQYDRYQGALRVKTSQTGYPEEYTVYDALGRETRKSLKRLNGDVYVDKEYDEYGRLSRESLPYYPSDNPLWKTYNYDDFDRLVSVAEPSGNTTTYSYAANEVTTTKDGISTTRTYNSQGQLTQAEDDGGTVTYSLDADGKPSSVTAPGNITTAFSYDGYRRRTSMVDPSLGTVTYTYDSAGNASSYSNAKGETVSYVYDDYNRLVSKSMPEQEFNFSYNSKGDMTSVVSDNGTSKAFAYDSFGRMASVTAHANDSVWLKKEFTYNANGRLNSTKYISQDGELCTESYVYSYNGWPVTNKRDLTTFYSLQAVNAFGQPTMATSGSLAREWEYTPYGLVSEIYAAQGTERLFLAYTYDGNTKNLIRYDDYTHDFHELYEYDDLNRLVAYGDNTVSYDNLGNITAKNSTGDYSYEGSSPYAVSEVTGAEPTINFTYTSFYRPASIGSSLTSSSFLYDENYDRVCMENHRMNMTLYGQPQTETVTCKFYLGGCYETDGPGGTEWLYLNGDYYTATSVLRKQGTVKTLYHIVRDRLGSVRQLIDASGNIVCEKDFDAWGNNRTLDSCTFANTVPFDRGFCGHEHLRGYINMNARLYDPFTGTFISPDPYIQSPDNSQNFNRYSYCLNNPLKYVDRDGKLAWFIPVIAAVVGGAMNVVANKDHIDNFWKGLSYFAVGAGAGVAGAYSGAAFWGSGGIIGGMLSGATGGFTSGFITGGFNSVLSTGSFNGFLDSAMTTGINSAAMGAFIGGVVGGTTAIIEGKDIWYGKSTFGTTPEQIDIKPTEPSTRQVDASASTSEVSNSGNSTNDVGTYDNAHKFYTTPDGTTVDVLPEIQRIEQGVLKRYIHGNDGTIFQNRESLLPPSSTPYYEYIIPTGNRAGLVRLIRGADGWWLSVDHYRTFIPIQ